MTTEGVSNSVIASVAKQSIVQHKERVDCFAALAMTLRHGFAISQQAFLLEACQKLPPRNKGRGECRAHGAPDGSCAKVADRMHTRCTGPPKSPGIPARNGFTAYIVLSPEFGFIVSVASRISLCPRPVGPTKLRETWLRHRGVGTTRFGRTRLYRRLRAANRSQAKARPAITFARQCSRVHRSPSRVR